MSIDVNNIADGYDIGKQLLEAYQAADDKEKFLDELDSLKGSGAISNYNRDTFRAYANKGIVPNGNISVISNAKSIKDLTELYDRPIIIRQDELNDLVQKEFDETQDNLNTNTNKIINNDNANHASLISDLDSNTDKIIANDNANFAVATTKGDELHDMVQKEFDDTQQLMTAKWDRIISILTVLGTSPLTEEDMAEVLAAS